MSTKKPYKQIQIHIDTLISKLGSDKTEAILHHISLNPKKYTKINSRDLTTQSKILFICMSNAGCKKVETFLLKSHLPYRKIYSWLTKQHTNLNNAQIAIPIETKNDNVFKYCKEISEIVECPTFNKELHALLTNIQKQVISELEKTEKGA